jgi:xanthine dehydrogenase accessory factor
MCEDQDALRLAAAVPSALCTIVGIDGSYSRRLGAQLAIAPDGRMAGTLADGCLEAELARQAARLRNDRKAAVIRYGAGSPILDFRLPCGARLDILIDPAPDRHVLHQTVECLDRREVAIVRLPLPEGTSKTLLQIRHYMPSLRIVILGTGPEPRHLSAFALGYGAEVEWRRPIGEGDGAGLSIGRPPIGLPVDSWTAIIILFHDHEWDDALLRWAMETPAFYVGAQGGHAVRERRKHQLREIFDLPTADRLHSPVGLIPNTRDPKMLALSILADIAAHYMTAVER